MKDKPIIFIGSSSEKANVAKLIARLLGKEEAIPKVWTKLFLAGSTYIEDLEQVFDQVDFAVFICTGDDYLKIRQEEREAPRDNVILELGMALGRLGRRRSFIVHPKGDSLRLPTDLAGVVPVPYENHSDEEGLKNELGRVCDLLAEAMEKVRPRPKPETDPPILAHLKRKVIELGDEDCRMHSFCG